MKKYIFFLYPVFLFLFTIFSYVFVDPNLSYFKSIYSGIAFSDRAFVSIFYIASIIIFFIFYGGFIYLGIKKHINLKQIFMLLGMTAVILLFSYPAMLSFDIFNYIATSKVLFLYHENPYVIMPIEFAGDPLLGFMHAGNKIALYGPSWLLLAGIPYLLGFGNFIVTLFSFKLFVSAFYIATSFFIWKMSKNNIISLILFSFNPLIVIEVLVSGHNDIAMMFFALFSIFLLTKKKIFPAIIFFLLSIFIKYATVFLLPVFLLMIWKIIKKKEVNLEKIFYYSSLLMFLGFFLSPIREEIYPWYAIWFLSFSFLSNSKYLIYISLAFSFGLLFRYVPFMLTGNYAGLTPFIKLIVTFVPPFLTGFYLVVKKNIWGKLYR
jgi:hypothetical protein